MPTSRFYVSGVTRSKFDLPRQKHKSTGVVRRELEKFPYTSTSLHVFHTVKILQTRRLFQVFAKTHLYNSEHFIDHLNLDEKVLVFLGSYKIDQKNLRNEMTIYVACDGGLKFMLKLNCNE